jgi:hypothetical protein
LDKNLHSIVATIHTYDVWRASIIVTQFIMTDVQREKNAVKRKKRRIAHFENQILNAVKDDDSISFIKKEVKVWCDAICGNLRKGVWEIATQMSPFGKYAEMGIRNAKGSEVEGAIVMLHGEYKIVPNERFQKNRGGCFATQHSGRLSTKFPAIAILMTGGIYDKSDGYTYYRIKWDRGDEEWVHVGKVSLIDGDDVISAEELRRSTRTKNKQAL